MIVSQIFCFLVIFGTSTAIVCPQGWTYYNDRCWFKSSHESSWLDGDQECRQRYGASLATVQSEREARFVEKLKKADESVLKFFDQSDPHFMDCFTKTEGAAILGVSVTSPSNIKTAEQCVEECAKSQERYDQICKSALWYKESKECVLNEKNRNDSEAVFVQDPDISGNIDYYEKICDSEKEETEEVEPSMSKKSGISKKKRKEITGIRSCFSKFKHSSLVGFVDKIHDNVTERECLTKCWRCEQCLTKEHEPCKSVIYYESLKQCVLTKESRRTQADYFDQTEPLAMFFERRKDCLFEMCEDQEIDLVFAIDGSQKTSWFGFEKSLKLIDSIVTAIHETTEFWRLTVVQVGTEGPAVIEIERKSFDTLDEFRSTLSTVAQRNSPGSRLGDSLVEVADYAMRIADTGETDFVWMLTLTSGSSDDSLDDFELMKKKNFFTSFAIGVGSDLDFVNLQKIATSNTHLIHSQETKTIIKEVISKLCPSSEVTPESKNESIESIEISLQQSKKNEIQKNKKMNEIDEIQGMKEIGGINEFHKMNKGDGFSSKPEAYKTGPWILHDETAMKFLTNKGIKTKVAPSTIVFMGESRNKNAQKFRKFLSSGEKLKKIASDFVAKFRGEKYWIGFRRSYLGPFEWSDGSKLEDYEIDKSRHLEVEMDSGDCIYWSDDLRWNQLDCFNKLQFVCNLKPIQTINEKLEEIFGNSEFDSIVGKSVFEKDLVPFENMNPDIPVSHDPQPQAPSMPQMPEMTQVSQAPIPQIPRPPEPQPQMTTKTPEFFQWGPDERFTMRPRSNPPSVTPPFEMENISEQKTLNPQNLLESATMSHILIPFGG